MKRNNDNLPPPPPPPPRKHTHSPIQPPIRPTDRRNTPPPPPRPGFGINVLLFLARPCFQGKPNDAMTSMQVTSKKQTGGIEWLPLEVFAAFFLSGGRRRWMRMGVRGDDRIFRNKNKLGGGVYMVVGGCTEMNGRQPRLTSREKEEVGGRVAVGRGFYCCISIGAVQIPRDY